MEELKVQMERGKQRDGRSRNGNAEGSGNYTYDGVADMYVYLMPLISSILHTAFL